MFDTYHYGRSGPSFPSSVQVDITERRAPTDDSIRLATEMREKLEKNIISRFKVENSKIDFDIVVFDDVFSFKTIVKFCINSREKITKVELDPFKSIEHNVQCIVESVAKAIALELLEPFGDRVLGEFRNGMFKSLADRSSA